MSKASGKRTSSTTARMSTLLSPLLLIHAVNLFMVGLQN